MPSSGSHSRAVRKLDRTTKARLSDLRPAVVIRLPRNLDSGAGRSGHGPRSARVFLVEWAFRFAAYVDGEDQAIENPAPRLRVALGGRDPYDPAWGIGI